MSACSSGFLLFLAIPVIAPTSAAWSQTPPPPPPEQSPYTLQVHSRVVLTDVTITDGKGNPIHGLTRSGFRIFDNGRPQTIASFEEHKEQRTRPGEFEQVNTGAFSNEFEAHPPPVMNVLLIDTTTITLVDQMYLYEELKKFVRDLPPGEPVAVFSRPGAMTLPLQNFTTNKQLLLAAIREAIPHIRMQDYWRRVGYDTLWQIASYVGQVPGRKNVLWFSGGSNAYLSPVPEPTLPPRPLYDMLEKERIALYPIDARGLSTDFGMWMTAQQQLMAQDAEATGGHAVYNNNALAQAAQKVLDTDGDYYTLTYTPKDLHQDGKWHKVTVKTSANKAQLSYRRGYYDDAQNDATPGAEVRTVLRRDGTKVRVRTDRSRPLVFQATVSEAGTESPADIPAKPPKKGETAFRIHYRVPASSIAPENINGNTGICRIHASILALDHYGEPITRIGERATIKVDEARIHADPGATLTFDQQINLPHGQDYLDILLWDEIGGRIGMVSVPMAVPKAKKR